MDNIDVSKCEYYGYEGECIVELKHCNNFLNCYYRQLQKKIQTCERLENDNTELKQRFTQDMARVGGRYIKLYALIEKIEDYCKDVKYDFGSVSVAKDILEMIKEGK